MNSDFNDMYDFYQLIRDYVFERMSISLGKVRLKLESDNSVSGTLLFSKLFNNQRTWEMNSSNGIKGVIELQDSLIRLALQDKYADLIHILRNNKVE